LDLSLGSDLRQHSSGIRSDPVVTNCTLVAFNIPRSLRLRIEFAQQREF
jgi:hypothetical protein